MISGVFYFVKKCHIFTNIVSVFEQIILQSVIVNGYQKRRCISMKGIEW